MNELELNWFIVPLVSFGIVSVAYFGPLYVGALREVS